MDRSRLVRNPVQGLRQKLRNFIIQEIYDHKPHPKFGTKHLRDGSLAILTDDEDLQTKINSGAYTFEGHRLKAYKK